MSARQLVAGRHQRRGIVRLALAALVAQAAYAVVGTALGVWFALSVVANLLPRDSWIRKAPFSWVLPEWRFFAPTPATHDYQIFYRVRSHEGRPGEPHFVRFPDPRWHRALLNPQSRTRKATRDAIEDLLSAAGRTSPIAEVGAEPPPTPSAGYGALLREIRGLTGGGDLVHRVQFGVLLIQGTQPPKVVFVSRWHQT